MLNTFSTDYVKWAVSLNDVKDDLYLGNSILLY